ncbi:MAG TPA: four helix bundle protein [Candidatus Angelobacter sp.]|nr:four helix bundle protein [Candidatus Angelobacter sp.]
MAIRFWLLAEVMMRNYRDLVWERAHKLTLELYRCSRSFPREEFYGLTSQMRRAATSVGANLAEGCGRQTTAEFARFVRIAMGSASELDYHLLLSHDLGYLPVDEHRAFAGELTRVRKMLASLLATLESAPKEKAARASGN